LNAIAIKLSLTGLMADKRVATLSGKEIQGGRTSVFCANARVCDLIHGLARRENRSIADVVERARRVKIGGSSIVIVCMVLANLWGNHAL
jgi:hypothetical protein